MGLTWVIKQSLPAFDVYDFWDVEFQLEVQLPIVENALSGYSRCGEWQKDFSCDKVPEFVKDFDTQSLSTNYVSSIIFHCKTP